MRSPHNFRYNPETCQYEHISLSIRSVIIYCLGILVTGAALFVGLTIFYDHFTESAQEAALRKENRALDKYQVLLTGQFMDVEETLSKLKSQDRRLYQKLFEIAPDANASLADKKTILLADASDFTDILKEVKEKSVRVQAISVATNSKFGAISISKNDIKILNAMPTLQPIANSNLDLLVSGYGIRINPFHKRKYKHPGIDFAAVRGTEVFASGAGKVIDINKSNLQAGSGNSIVIDHGHGFITSYAHLEEINVREGQWIKKGTIIGTVGNSGGSIAPHLHYEVIHKGENVDPMAYMIEGLSSNEYNKLISRSKKQNQSLD